MTKEDLKFRTNPFIYFSSGYIDAIICLSALERHGFDLRNAQAVLEFGCGTARVLRHLRGIAELRRVGTDANPEPIRWCRQNLDGIEFHTNTLQPPLAFADDASFDLVYALSVFTHIPLPLQRPWLEELRRVLKPDGYVLCTVLGAYEVAAMLDERDRDRLRTEGGLTLEANDPKASYSTQVLGSWDVFQTHDQLLASFGAVFDVLEYRSSPNGLDMLILRPSQPRSAVPSATQLSPVTVCVT